MPGRALLIRSGVLTLGLLCVTHLVQSWADEPQVAPDATAELRKKFADYQSWKLVMEKAVPDSSRYSCSPARSRATPHEGRFIRVFVSPQGENSYAKWDGKQFPEGTIVVKEKFRKKADEKPAELGVMIKRKEGFSPATQDWEYVFVDHADKTQVGAQLDNCARCHGAAKADCVFGVGQGAVNADHAPSDANRAKEKK